MLRINQEKVSGLQRCGSTDRSSHFPHRISIQFLFLDSLTERSQVSVFRKGSANLWMSVTCCNEMAYDVLSQTTFNDSRHRFLYDSAWKTQPPQQTSPAGLSEGKYSNQKKRRSTDSHSSKHLSHNQPTLRGAHTRASPADYFGTPCIARVLQGL